MSHGRKPKQPRAPWSVVFAQGAQDHFNARFHGVLRDLTRDTMAALGQPLVALVVTGAYGEGNGRCLPVQAGAGSGLWSQGQAPADELELLVVANASRRLVARQLRPVASKYSAILRVGVHFVRVLDQAALDSIRPSLAWYELVQFHHMLYGPDAVFRVLRERFGIREDACALPDFQADEAQWIHSLSGFRLVALPWARDDAAPPKDYSATAFLAIRRLGDALLIHRHAWDPDPEARFRAISQIIQQEAPFTDQAQASRVFQDLLHASRAWFHPVDAPPAENLASALSLDALARSWLLVDDAIRPRVWRILGGEALSRRILHAWVKRWLQHALRTGTVRPSRLAGCLLARFGAWYYRLHQ